MENKTDSLWKCSFYKKSIVLHIHPHTPDPSLTKPSNLYWYKQVLILSYDLIKDQRKTMCCSVETSQQPASDHL